MVISQQSSTTFSDKEQIWADNAVLQPVLRQRVRLLGGVPRPGEGQRRSGTVAGGGLHDGGDTWTQHQISAAANNGQRNPTDGCTSAPTARATPTCSASGRSPRRQPAIRADVRRRRTAARPGRRRGRSPARSPSPASFDPVQGRPVIDGVAGARSDLAPAPSVDIANGAPTGADATDRIVMSYVSGPLATAARVLHRVDQPAAPPGRRRGRSRRPVTAASTPLRPSRRTARTSTSCTTRSRRRSSQPRPTRARLVGVVLHADSATGPDRPGAFRQLHRGRRGTARGSSANALTDEFLGDYVYAAATRTYGAAVWNDARNAADCPAIDAWRQALQNGTTPQPRRPARLPGRTSETPISSASRRRPDRGRLAATSVRGRGSQSLTRQKPRRAVAGL